MFIYVNEFDLGVIPGPELLVQLSPPAHLEYLSSQMFQPAEWSWVVYNVLHFTRENICHE